MVNLAPKEITASTCSWMGGVTNFLKTGGLLQSKPFMCHACELNDLKRKTVQEPKKTDIGKYQGYLHCYEYDCLISPPFGNLGVVDIHAFGDMQCKCCQVSNSANNRNRTPNAKVMGVHHAVVDIATAVQFARNTARSIQQPNDLPAGIRYETSEIVIPNFIREGKMEKVS